MPRPQIRMLFDELASVRVARALAELGFKVTHVGAPGQPHKGSPDEVVLASAEQEKRTIVTNNHDMIVLCAEKNHSVIWLDPRDKDMTFAAQVLMCFGQIGDWDRELAYGPPRCIVVRKTTHQVIPLDTASRLAKQRGQRRSRARRRRRRIEPRTLLDAIEEESNSGDDPRSNGADMQ